MAGMTTCADQLARWKEMLDAAIEYAELCEVSEEKDFLDVEAAIVQLRDARTAHADLSKRLAKQESKLRSRMRTLAQQKV
jgi:hypothetical protein